jgi:hypothetical protein
MRVVAREVAEVAQVVTYHLLAVVAESLGNRQLRYQKMLLVMAW